jgi:hypothetical protein
MGRQLTFKNASYTRAISRIQRRRGLAIAVIVIGEFLIVATVIGAVFQLSEGARPSIDGRPYPWQCRSCRTACR